MIKEVSTTAAVFFLALPAEVFAETSVRRQQTAMMTKPVVCRVLQEARGKSGEDLVAADIIATRAWDRWSLDAVRSPSRPAQP